MTRLQKNRGHTLQGTRGNRAPTTSSHTLVATDRAPKPGAHFSQASRFGDLIFTSGQGPINPTTGTIVSNDIGEQTRQTIENLRGILEAAGSSLANVLKVTVYLRHMEDFAGMNEVYATFFPDGPPPRSTVGVVLGTPLASTHTTMNVEIELVAYVSRDSRKKRAR